ncbi:MAG: ethylbenzene dehydrogenase-related protein [Candidatus Binatia bacterium]
MSDASQFPNNNEVPEKDDFSPPVGTVPVGVQSSSTDSEIQVRQGDLPVDFPSPAIDEDFVERSPVDHRRTDRTPPTERRREKSGAKAHFFVTLTHWSMATLLVLNLLSGMRIGWGYTESLLWGAHSWIGGVSQALAPKGTLFGINLITFHVWSSFLMLLMTGIYVVYLFRSRAVKRLHITKKDLQHLTWARIRVSSFWHSKPALWSANLITYWVAFGSFGVLLLTGLALYRLDWGLSSLMGGQEVVRWIHGIFAYVLIPYMLVHSILQWAFGRFWAIFKAQLYRPHMIAGAIGVAVSIPLVWGFYAFDSVPDTLTAHHIPANVKPPVLDGYANDPVWDHAQAVTVRTNKGVNNPHDYVDISVKAIHDGENIYFQFQWADPDVSYKRYPLIKTAAGWKMLQTAYENADENEFYEDKLAMYITDVPQGSCAATCHLGVGPYSEKGMKHGLHYTEPGEIGDVWHWKSVRTNHMGDLLGEPGFMDDQHFRPIEPVPAQLKERYTGGYYTDPKTGGGYEYNYKKVYPDKPIGETTVLPIKLPRAEDIRPNIDPTTSDYGIDWWIHPSQGIPYSAEADTYPVGTLIPNILIEPFQGDRADIRAKGTWEKGVWTLEARRALDTKSKFDVAFTPEKPLYLSLGTFNRSQTRHSEHIKPIKLVLEK